LLVLPGFALTSAAHFLFASFAASPPSLAKQSAELALSGCLFAAVSLALARFLLPEFLAALPGPLRRLGGGADGNAEKEE
jgi:hypothetical protein